MIKIIEEELRKYLNPDVKLILEVGNYIFDGGGKRIRPYLVLTFSKLFKGENEKRDFPLAVAMEYLHTASLLHDDVVDMADTRRGKPSANKVFGNDVVVLVGDYMYADALYLFSIYGDIDMIRNVSDAVKKMAEGQLLELKKIGDLDITEEEYFKILTGKTAALFASCCYVGAKLGEAEEKQLLSAYNYGLYLGLAFQIVDDILDYTADKNKVGKPVCNDIKEGKITYPLLSIMDKLTEEEFNLIKKVVRSINGVNEEDILKIKEIVIKYGGIEKSINKAKELINKALKELENFPENDYLKELENLAKFVVEREF